MTCTTPAFAPKELASRFTILQIRPASVTAGLFLFHSSSPISIKFKFSLFQKQQYRALPPLFKFGVHSSKQQQCIVDGSQNGWCAHFVRFASFYCMAGRLRSSDTVNKSHEQLSHGHQQLLSQCHSMHHHEAKWKPKDSQLFPACPL
jgi:hypothetical protein